MQNETQYQNVDSQEVEVEEAPVQTEAPQEQNIGVNTDPYQGPEAEEPADIIDPKVTMNPEDLFGPETTEEPGDMIDIEDISADPLGLDGDGLPDDIIIDNLGSTDWDEIGSRTPEYVPELFEDEPAPTDQVDPPNSEAAATPFPEAVSMPHDKIVDPVWTDQEEAPSFEPGTGTDPGVIPDHGPDTGFISDERARELYEEHYGPGPDETVSRDIRDFPNPSSPQPDGEAATGVQEPDPTRADLQQFHVLGTEEEVDGGEHVPHPDDTSIIEVPDLTHPEGPQPTVIVDPDSEPGSTPNDGDEHVPHPDDWEDEPTQPNHTPHPDDTSIIEVPDLTHPEGPQPTVIVDPDSEPTVTDAEPPVWEEATEVIEDVAEVIEDVGQDAQDGITEAAYALGDTVGDAVDSYFDAVDDINEALYDGVGDAAEAVWEAGEGAYDAVGEAVGDAADAVWEFGGDAADAVEDAADTVWEFGGDAAGAVAGAASTVGAEAAAVAGAVGTGVGVAAGAVWEFGGDAADAVEDAADAVWEFGGDAADAVGDAFEDAGDEIASWFD